MPDPSIVQQSWAQFRAQMVDPDQDAEGLDTLYRTFLAGYAAALITISVLDKPNYASVRQVMLDAAKRECDAILTGTPDA